MFLALPAAKGHQGSSGSSTTQTLLNPMEEEAIPAASGKAAAQLPVLIPARRGTPHHHPPKTGQFPGLARATSVGSHATGSQLCPRMPTHSHPARHNMNHGRQHLLAREGWERASSQPGRAAGSSARSAGPLWSANCSEAGAVVMKCPLSLSP